MSKPTSKRFALDRIAKDRKPSGKLAVWQMILHRLLTGPQLSRAKVRKIIDVCLRFRMMSF